MPSIALIVCVVGGLVYLVASLARNEGKIISVLAELGRLSFVAGLLAFLLK